MKLLLLSLLLCLVVVTMATVAQQQQQQQQQQQPQPQRPVLDMTTPPMGFMSWERFECTVDCAQHPHDCIDESLYQTSADALVEQGYAAAGYTIVAVDDCWTTTINSSDSNSSKGQGRDPATHQLQADPERFPHGMKALGDYLHDRGLLFGLYADAGSLTCANYTGSEGYEDIDAHTFATWGVDYLKMDACNIHHNQYETRFTAWGTALQNSARVHPMYFSCCWPVYVGGDNETRKRQSDHLYDTMYYQAGCNTWRNFHFIDNHWDRLYRTIQHWADYWQDLQAIPFGSFNDADALLAGDDHFGHVLSLDMAKLQFGFWAMIASPLFIGGDVRAIPPAYQRILLNSYVIAISQDPSRRQADCVQGCRSSAFASPTKSQDIQVWKKRLQGGASTALAFFNLNSPPNPTPNPNESESGAFPRTITNASHSSLQNTDDTYNITYVYELEILEDEELTTRILRCVDVWSDTPQENLCGHPHTVPGLEQSQSQSQYWDIRIQTAPMTMTITALNVPPSSHRLLQVDFQHTTSNSNRNSKKTHDDGITVSA